MYSVICQFAKDGKNMIATQFLMGKNGIVLKFVTKKKRVNDRREERKEG